MNVQGKQAKPIEKGSQPFVRDYRDTSDPELVLSEDDIVSKIDKALRGSHSTAFLFQGRPGDGTTFSLERILTKCTESLGLAPNMIKLGEPDRSLPAALSNAPYVIQTMVGRKASSWLTHISLRWASLRGRQKLLAVCGLAGYIAIVNILTLDFITENRLTLLEVALQTIVNLVAVGLPLIGNFIWRRSSIEAMNEGLEESIPKLKKTLSRNNYSAIRRHVTGRNINRPAPVLIAIDSLEDMEPGFDWDFIESSLLPRLSGTYKTILLGVSKWHSEARLRFLALAKQHQIFNLQPLPLACLKQLTDQPKNVRHGMPVKAVLQTGSRHQVLLEESQTKIKRSLAARGFQSLNLATLAILVTHPPRHSTDGFSRAGVRKRLIHILEIIEEIAPRLQIEIELDSDLPSFLERAQEQMILAYDENSGRYQTEPFARFANPLFDNSFWTALSALSWLSSTGIATSQQPTGKDVYEAEYLAADLRRSLGALVLEDRAGIERIDFRNVLARLAVLVERSHRLGLPGLTNELALSGLQILKFCHDSKSEVPDSAETSQALFQCLVLQGRCSAADLPNLLGKRKTAALHKVSHLLASLEPSFLVSQLVSNLESNSSEASGDTDKDRITLGLDQEEQSSGDSPENWLDFWWRRRALHLFKLLGTDSILQTLGDHAANAVFGQTQSGLAGGFNVNTYLRLFALSDAVDIRAFQRANQILSDLATGLTFLQGQRLTIWERIWVELASLICIFEYVRFISAISERKPHFTFEAYRQDLVPQSLQAEVIADVNRMAQTINNISLADQGLPITPRSIKKIRENYFEMNLRLDLLGYYELARVLEFFYLRFIWTARSFERLSAEIRQQYFERLSDLAVKAPSTLHPDLDLDSMMLFYRAERSLNVQSVGRVLLKILDLLENKGVPPMLREELVRMRLNDLLLSRHDRDRLSAARLLVKHARRRFKPGRLDQIEATPEVICDACDSLLLASGILIGFGKVQSARTTWRYARRLLDDLALPFDAPESLQSKATENRAFSLALRIDLWRGENDRTILPLVLGALADREQRGLGGRRYLRLLSSAAHFVPEENLSVLLTAVVECSEMQRYRKMRQWIFILRSLVHRRMVASDASREAELTFAISATFSRFTECNRSEISFGVFRSILPGLLELASDGSEINAALVLAIHDDLMRREVIALHSDLLALDASDWTALERIGRAHFRLLELRVVGDYPSDIQDWNADNDPYQVLRERGLALIKKYGPEWQAIPVMIRLSSLARKQGDLLVQEKLRHNWRLVGLACIDSLLQAAKAKGHRDSGAIRDALNEQLAAVQALRQKRA